MVTLSGLLILFLLGSLLFWNKVKHIFRPLSNVKTIYGFIIGASIGVFQVAPNYETSINFFSYINQGAVHSAYFWLSHIIIGFLIVLNAVKSNSKYQNGMNVILWSIIGVMISTTIILAKISFDKINHIDGEAGIVGLIYVIPPFDFLMLIINGYQYLLINVVLSILILIAFGVLNSMDID